jgi:cytochrome c-type biogenesis protein
MLVYILLFVEGVLAFISPCILPLIPIYLVYITGQTGNGRKKLITNTLGFILGFTIVFVTLGATATLLGALFKENQLLIQRISGIIIIIMGFNYLGVLKIPFINISGKFKVNTSNLSFMSSILFGISFSFCWSACLSSILGSAFMIAANEDTVYEGMFMLFIFSMGLAVPFFITAMIFDKLTKVFVFIKTHYTTIKVLSGLLLIAVGLSLALDLFDYWTGIFN